MALRYLFVDMNSFFASVEQQLNPRLRGRPVAVVPVDANTTGIIAASIEAKRHGIKTNTPVWEAKQKCPGIVLIVAHHQKYLNTHEQIVRAVGSCLPVSRVMSIDEMNCALMGEEREPDVVSRIAKEIKIAIHREAGEWMRCSIGVGPSVMLAKVAADMQKPDGFTMIRSEDLPHALLRLTLTDFPGIGPRMEKRFHKYGITTVQQLVGLSAAALCQIWGSRVHGWRWWYLLRGDDVPDKPTKTKTIGHSHVLPPNLRNEHGAQGVVAKLVHKAAARLRKANYWAGAIALDVGTLGRERWSAIVKLPQCQDTPLLLGAVSQMWAARPKGPPYQVGVTLTELVPAKSATPSLFEQDRKPNELSHAMDAVNRAMGPNTVYFGGMFGRQLSAPMRVSFTHIPDEETESADSHKRYGWG